MIIHYLEMFLEPFSLKRQSFPAVFEAKEDEKILQEEPLQPSGGTPSLPVMKSDDFYVPQVDWKRKLWQGIHHIDQCLNYTATFSYIYNYIYIYKYIYFIYLCIYIYYKYKCLSIYSFIPSHRY